MMTHHDQVAERLRGRMAAEETWRVTREQQTLQMGDAVKAAKR